MYIIQVPLSKEYSVANFSFLNIFPLLMAHMRGGWLYACGSECTWVTDACCYCCLVAVMFNSLWPMDCSRPGSSLPGFPRQEDWSGLLMYTVHPPKSRYFQGYHIVTFSWHFFYIYLFSINRSRWLKKLISFFFKLSYCIHLIILKISNDVS